MKGEIVFSLFSICGVGGTPVVRSGEEEEEGKPLNSNPLQ